MLLPTTLLLLTSLVILILSYLLFSHFKQTKNDDRKPPPGPPVWTVIRNLHMLGSVPHRTFQTMAKRYGPIMSLRIGHVPIVVISSPEAAEHVLKTHDVVLANRPKIQASKIMFYGSKGMVFTEYSPYFRHVRKLCTLNLLTASKVEMFRPIRNHEVEQLVMSLREAAAAREVVNLSKMVEEAVEDITNRTILGRKGDHRFDLKKLVEDTVSLLGAFNLADLVPFLGHFDLQGLTRRFKKHAKDLDKMLETIIKEHECSLDDVHDRQRDRDFVDILLSFMAFKDDQPNLIVERTNIKAILLEMIAGTIETSPSLILWAFSQLLRHPRVMKNVQDELQNIVGMHKMVEEIDLPRLKYLDMVLKETFRLYPVVPLLIPRESCKDVVIDGYYIKKKSRIMVNYWAIGRDAKIWSENVEEFYPERFEKSNIEMRGHDFLLLPFGSGRRGCPGMQLGLATSKIILAQLVHCFKWKLPHDMNPTDLDMAEIFGGLTMRRANPLLALPTYRLAI